MKPMRMAALAIGILTGSAGLAFAQQAQDKLRVGMWQTFPTTDFYYHNNREGSVYARLVWDTLIDRDPETGEYKPLMASSWSWKDEMTLAFKLREDIVFHDGSRFTADDVVATIGAVIKPGSGVTVPSNYSWIKSAERTDDFGLLIHLSRPFPAALEYVSMVMPIYPKAYYEKVGTAGMGTAPIGSGPYRSVSLTPGQVYELERFDRYMPNSPKGPAKIAKIQIRMIPDGSTQLAELLGGGLDWIWRVPDDKLAQLKAMPGIAAISGETMRIGYLSLDAAGRTSTKPLQDVRVRRAIAHAINWDKIAKSLVSPVARAVPAPCFPSQFGCEEAMAVKYDYNPAKARALLAEAGLAGGFQADLYGVRARELTEAIASDLQAVNIKPRISQVQAQALVARTRAGEAPMYFWDWGSFSINDVSAIMANFFGDSPENYSRDKDVIEWIKIADSSGDRAKRREFYGKAIQRITDQAYWLPGFTFAITYAYTDKLDFKSYTDEFPRFNLYSWKK